MSRRKSIDMCNGPILKSIVLFALPMMATSLLQMLYNAADQIVVAKWAGGTALAAVGSNGSLINLLVNLFGGLALGVNVVVARYYGAEDHQSVAKATHTAVLLGAICGVVSMCLGLFLCRPALEWMGSPADVIDQAELYLRIYFLGVPFAMIYNYGAAVLRAVGDSRRPLQILAVSGMVNVVLNLVLVIVFHLDVAGVAIATSVSQVVSAAMVLSCLFHASETPYQLHWSDMKLSGKMLGSMLRFGIPAALQGCVFSVSNIVLQSAVNTFGAAGMAGCAADTTFENLIFMAMDAVRSTGIVFIGQNIGARKPKRVVRGMSTCFVLVTAVGIVLGAVIILLRNPLFSLYTAAAGTETAVTAEELVFYGTQRMMIVATTYFICGLMNTAAGVVQAIGLPWAATASSVFATVVLRLIWIKGLFPHMEHSIFNLFLCYPISWIVALLLHVAVLFFKLPPTLRKTEEPTPPESATV